MKIGNNWFRYAVALAAVAFGALGAVAGSGSSAAITDVTAQQRYPWNGKVDISYTVTDVARTATDLGMNPAIKVLAVDRTTTPWTTNVADSSALFVGPLGVEALTDDVATSDGTHQIVWDMNAQGLTFASTNVIFAVLGGAKEPGVQLWENGPYFAECNVGASKPEEYGYYFWWGDTVGYKRNSANNGWVSSKDGTTAFLFSSGNCPTYEKTVDQLTADGYIDGAGNLVADHDAATAHLGAPWRMPTAAELKALVANCTTSWITTNGVTGRLVKGKDGYASKSIFLPAAGYGNNSNHNNANTHGRYWSSTPDSSGSDVAGYLYIYASSLSATMISRYYGQSVRPVRIASGGGSSLPSLLCTGESDPVRADLRTGTRVAAPTETLTYSADWCGGDSVALAANGETLEGAGALTGSGTYNWTPNKVGTIALTHTVVTGSVPVVLSATFTVLSVPEVEVKVPDPMPENTWFSVLTNGVTVEQTGDRFLVPSNATDVTVLFTAASGYYFEDGSTVITKTLDTSKNPAEIQGGVPSAPVKLGVTNVTARQRYPWNGLVDIDVTIVCGECDVEDLRYTFVATNTATKKAITVGTITPCAPATGSGVNWQRSFVWDAQTDLGNVQIKDITLVAEVWKGSVDLGLNYVVSTFYVGSTSPTDVGLKYAWGEVTTKKSYDEANSLTHGKTKEQLQAAGIVDADGNLTPEYDVATQRFGAPWRLPTKDEWEELKTNCVWTYTTVNGVKGSLLTSKLPGNSSSLFLPVTGYINGTALSYAVNSYFWSSTISTQGSPANTHAYGIKTDNVYNTISITGTFDRRTGVAIIAVRSKEAE